MLLTATATATATALVLLLHTATAQTFQRLGACPDLGCVLPPTQTDFLAGAYFDIRLEVHAPVNGSEANGGKPDEAFTFTIQHNNGPQVPAAKFFGLDAEPRIERWNFTWFEDLFAKDAGKPSLVNVAAKAYRHVTIYAPGDYNATLSYYNGTKTVATWHVRRPETLGRRKARNILLFIGDGMTTNMITAARLLGHRSVNGRYQSTLAMDKFPTLGHQMTHSIDSFITDSANSATALYTGHKCSVNNLGVYADSSKSPFDDPKIETIVELFRRLTGGGVGIVSTAFLADATPAALTAHTRDRSVYAPIIDAYLNGIKNYTWTNFSGPDVLFGGGAESFLPSGSLDGSDYYRKFQDRQYALVHDNTTLQKSPNSSRTLGVFSKSVMAKWLDRNVYPANLRNTSSDPRGGKGDALDQPGLKEMTLKAIDILHARTRSTKNQVPNDKDKEIKSTTTGKEQEIEEKGWFMMSEAANIDKMMHALDYDRALGDLLELDDTISASIHKLKSLNVLDETLIIVTADHGHGFDVFGSVDTKYMNAQTTDRKRREAVGVYGQSGLSQYTIGGSEGVHFPTRWDPRYTLAQGVAAMPDHRENYQVRKGGVRVPATNATRDTTDLYANPRDGAGGYLVNGTLPVSEAQGVHSLTDVPVFAMGPGAEMFGGVYNNIDIFFKMADVLDLGRTLPPVKEFS